MTISTSPDLTPEQNARATALQIAKPLLASSNFLSTNGVASSDLGSLITLADYIIDGHPPLMLMDADGRRGIVLTPPDEADETTVVEDLTDPAVEPDRTVIQPQFEANDPVRTTKAIGEFVDATRNPDNTDTAPTPVVSEESEESEESEQSESEPNVVIESNTFTGADVNLLDFDQDDPRA